MLTLLNPSLDLPELLDQLVLDLQDLAQLHLQPLILLLDLLELARDDALGLPQSVLQLAYHLLGLSHAREGMILGIRLALRV